MFVTIHGHFYQPPREDPWTGLVPRQESAAPYHDWNERITDECYGPNGRSRVLDPHGRIAAIVNNFAHLSFDFGPTLLSDLERRHPAVYRRIQEADRASAALHGGHGSGFAQGYNHMILPLATHRDKWTQVRWGLRDFEYRFGRRSEGLWLPETACDAETLQVVADAGVRFLVLAPHQALRYRRLGEKSWHDAPAGSIDPSRPYRCFVGGAGQTRRHVDIWFYDGPMSVAASFEHLLVHSERLADRLLAAGRHFPAHGLVHFATDGEVYGHHEPFADMCLAYLFYKEGPRRGIRFVNYAEALDLTPPEHEVQLNYTDTGEGTAWSCAHGVGRWARDCGCSNGGRDGWNQKWRLPLRRGLDAIRDEIQGAFLTQTSPVLKDAWAARDDYIEVLLDRSEESREAFLARHLRGPVDEPVRRMVWSLLEATHQAMLMYTSCAWFFADISGLEVQQNLAYAARACELAQPYLVEPLEALLLRHLEQARSNLPEWKNGARVYHELVLARRTGPEHAAARAALEAAVLGRPLDRRIVRYAVKGTVDAGCRGQDEECTGQVRIEDPEIEQCWSWGFRVSPGSVGRKEVALSPVLDRNACVPTFTGTMRLRDFDREVREEIARSALSRALHEEIDRIEEIYDDTRAPIGVLLDLGLPVPDIHRTLGVYVLNQRFRELAAQVADGREPVPQDLWSDAERILEEARALGLEADPAPLAARLTSRINLLLERAVAEKEPSAALADAGAAYETVKEADRLRLPIQRTGLEPRTYDLVLRFKSELRRITGVSAKTLSDVEAGLDTLRDLAGHANLQLETILREGSARTGERPALTSMGGMTRDAQR